MGRPINKRHFGRGPFSIQPSSWRRSTGPEDDAPAYIKQQRSVHEFVIAAFDDSWEENMFLVDKDGGLLNPGEFRIEAIVSDTVFEINRLNNRLVQSDDFGKTPWNRENSELISQAQSITNTNIAGIDILSGNIMDGGLIPDNTGPADLFISNNAEWDAVMAMADADLSGLVAEITGPLDNVTLRDGIAPAAGLRFTSSGAGSINRLTLSNSSNITFSNRFQMTGWPADYPDMIQFITGTNTNLTFDGASFRHGYGTNLDDFDTDFAYPEYARPSDVQTSTTTSTAYSLPWVDATATEGQLWIFNEGSTVTQIAVGDASVVADFISGTTIPVGPGITRVTVNPSVDTHYALITSAGTSTIRVRPEIGLSYYLADCFASFGSAQLGGDFRIQNCTFTDVSNGVKGLPNDIAGEAIYWKNDFARIYQDIIALGARNATTTWVVDNLLTVPFSRSGIAEGLDGDPNDPHGDLVQYFTNLAIGTVENLYILGNRTTVPPLRPGATAQGLFISDNDFDPSYRNVLSVGNFMIGGSGNGLAIGETNFPAEDIVSYGDTLASWQTLNNDATSLRSHTDENGDVVIIDGLINDISNTGTGIAATEGVVTIRDAADPAALLPNYADRTTATTREDVVAAWTGAGDALGKGFAAVASLFNFNAISVQTVFNFNNAHPGVAWNDVFSIPRNTVYELGARRVLMGPAIQTFTPGADTEIQVTSDGTTVLTDWTTAAVNVNRGNFINLRTTMPNADLATVNPSVTTANGYTISAAVTSNVTLGSTFQTGATTVFVDPVNAAANTSVVEFEFKGQLNSDTNIYDTLFAQLSAIRVQLRTTATTSLYRAYVEDSAGTIILNNLDAFQSLTDVIPTGTPFIIHFTVDYLNQNTTLTINGQSETIAFDSAPVSAFAQTNRAYIMNGLTATTEQTPVGTDIEYMRIYTTVNGTRSLHKEISIAAQGSLAGINADPWHSGNQVTAGSTPLSAVSAIADVTLNGGPATFDIDVTYSDDTGIDVSSITPAALEVSGPNGNLVIESVAVDVATDGTPRVATFTVEAPLNGWNPVDNGTYTVTALPMQVADTDGNFAFENSTTFDVNVDERPLASTIQVADVNAAGGTSHDIVVTFTDDNGIDVSTISTANISITPGAFTVTGAAVDVNTDGSPRVVTYTVTPPGGTWTVGDNNTYDVTLASDSVFDISGNPVISFNEQFTVAIPDGSPEVTFVSTTDITASNTDPVLIEVQITDDVAVDISSIDVNDLTITGPNNTISTSQVTLDTTVDTTPVGATFQINAPVGGWTPDDNGTYTVGLPAATIQDTSLNDNAAASSTFNVSVAGPSPALSPEPLVGFGANTTGGRGQTVYRVTSTSSGTGAGTFRDAVSAPNRYVCLCVEGEINLPNRVEILANTTIDGRFAPGNGCWFSGNRIDPEGDNIMILNVRHLGNDNPPGGDSDCMSLGNFSSDTTSTSNQNNVYLRDCTFRGGRDETLSFFARPVNTTTGRTLTNVTTQRCIVADAMDGNQGPSHQFGSIIGDGCTRITLTENFYSNITGRAPCFARGFSGSLEVFNNFLYNCGGNGVHPMHNDSDEMHFFGNVFHDGPISNGQACIRNSGATMYEVDNIVSAPPASGYSSNLRETPETGTYVTSSLFTGSGLTAYPSSNVEGRVPVNAGAKLYGGGRSVAETSPFDDYEAGTTLTTRYSYPLTAGIPTTTGATYPTNTNGIPTEYSGTFPGDTDLGAIITDGTTWDGYMVAERVGAWHVWDGQVNNTPTYVTGAPIVANSVSASITVPTGYQAGDVVLIAVQSRAVDTDPLIDFAASTFAGAQPVPLPVISPTNTSGGVQFRIYTYVVPVGETTGLQFATTDAGINAISATVYRGAEVPTSYSTDTDTQDLNGTAISIPGGSATLGNLWVGILSSGADSLVDIVSAFTGTGLTNITLQLSDNSDVNNGFGMYVVTGTVDAATVGNLTATATVADTWLAATMELRASS